MTSPARRPLHQAAINGLNTHIAGLSERLLDENRDRQLIAEDALDVLQSARDAMQAAVRHAAGAGIAVQVASEALAEYKRLRETGSLGLGDPPAGGPPESSYPYWCGRLASTLERVLGIISAGQVPGGGGQYYGGAR